jgi:hypothetical protein
LSAGYVAGGGRNYPLMLSIKALDAKITRLQPIPRFLISVGMVLTVIVVLPLAFGVLLRQYDPPKQAVVKSLEETLTDSDQVVRDAATLLLRRHGMTDVEINNWLAACDQQAKTLHVLKGREMLVRGVSQEAVDSYMQMPVMLDTSLSQCRLPADSEK